MRVNNVSSALKEALYVIGFVFIAPFRVRKLERRFKILEREHRERVVRFTATMASCAERIEEMERRFKLLERDYYEQFMRSTATAAFYEQRIERLMDLYSKRLADRASSETFDEHPSTLVLPQRKRDNGGAAPDL